MNPLNPITLKVLSTSVIFSPWTPEATRRAGISNEHVKLLLLSITFYFSTQYEYRVLKIVIKCIEISNQWQYIWIIWSYSVWKNLAWMFHIKIILKNIGYMELTSPKLVLHSEINVIDNQRDIMSILCKISNSKDNPLNFLPRALAHF